MENCSNSNKHSGWEGIGIPQDSIVSFPCTPNVGNLSTNSHFSYHPAFTTVSATINSTSGLSQTRRGIPNSTVSMSSNMSGSNSSISSSNNNNNSFGSGSIMYTAKSNQQSSPIEAASIRQFLMAHHHHHHGDQQQFSENSTCCGSEENNLDDFLDAMGTTASTQSSSSSTIINASNSGVSGYKNIPLQVKGKIQQATNGSAGGMMMMVNGGMSSNAGSGSLNGHVHGGNSSINSNSNSNNNNNNNNNIGNGISSMGSEEAKYKTEMCKNWVENNRCNYGEKCKFAHGKNELVQKMAANKHFKTKNCKQFFEMGTCNYGPRCHFLHDTRQIAEIASSTMGLYSKKILNPDAFFDFTSNTTSSFSSSANLKNHSSRRLSCFLSFKSE